MKEELETLVTQVKALLTECLQGWLQALSQGDSVDDPASLGQLAVQLSTAYSTLQAAAAAYPGPGLYSLRTVRRGLPGVAATPAAVLVCKGQGIRKAREP